MSAVVQTLECYPTEVRWGLLVMPAPEPAHERCSGGQTRPGVLGGWVCPCPCHRATSNGSSPACGQPDAAYEPNGSRDPGETS